MKTALVFDTKVREGSNLYSLHLLKLAIIGNLDNINQVSFLRKLVLAS